jgi:hypothetical protein
LNNCFFIFRQKIITDKPKQEERVNQTISRGKEIQDNEYLTPEQKEHITRECRDIEVNWNDFTNQLDDAKTRYGQLNRVYKFSLLLH